jgi:single-strand DNA-binding protein
LKNITIAGRLTRDAENRSTQTGESITAFAVAVDDGFGENKRALFFDCSMWGKRGAAVAGMLTKGKQVTVSGDFSTREYEGKTYLQLRVADLTLQGGGKQDNANPPRNDPPQGRGDDMGEDSIPF